MVSMSKAGAASLSAVGGKGRLEQDGVRGPGVSLWEAVPAARWSISPSVCSASHHFSTQQLPHLLPGFIQYQGALPGHLEVSGATFSPSHGHTHFQGHALFSSVLNTSKHILLLYLV